MHIPRGTSSRAQGSWKTPMYASVKKKTPAPTQEQLQECKSLLEAVSPDNSKGTGSLEQQDGYLIIDGVRMKINDGNSTGSLNLII